MTELTPAYSKAIKLEREIKANAQLAQEAIFAMSVAINTMNEEKLFLEFGYGNIEDYCENEIGIKHTQIHKYIRIAKNVHPGVHLEGVTVSNLYLLSTLTEEQQTEICEKVDIKSISRDKLKEEIADLKKSNEGYSKMVDLRDENIKKLKGELETLRKTIDELESRPIPVEYTSKDDDSYHLNDRKLAETIASLERNNIEQNENLARQYEEQNKETERRLIEEKKQAVAALKAEYEAKFAELKEAQRNPKAPDDDKEVFEAYFASASDSCDRLIEYANSKANPFFTQKIREFVDKLANNIMEVK